MTHGDKAISGDADFASQIGSMLSGRTVGGDVYSKLIDAALQLGDQSGSALSLERILTTIQASSGPANLVQIADAEWGAALSRFGEWTADLKRRALQAREDLASASSTVSHAQRLLEESVDSAGSDDGEWARAGLRRSIGNAEEDVASALHRLRALDEERMGADASAMASITDQLSKFASARNAMPDAPRVSAGVTVSVRLPDGTDRRVSATDLAKISDPAEIRGVWDALTPAEREQLILDFPLLIGNLEGIPLRDRNTANVITARAYRAELEKQIETLGLVQQQAGVTGAFAEKIEGLRGEVRSIDAILGDRNERYANVPGFGRYTMYDEHGSKVVKTGTTLVSFDPLRDSIVTFQGPLDPQTGDIPAWMQHVGVYVPGTNSALSEFTNDLRRVNDLVYMSGQGSGYFAWHGAPMPQWDPPGHIVDAAERGFGDVAAPRLTSFVNSLRLPSHTEVIPIAHSYGAAVLGGAEYLGLEADRVVYVAPAGFGHNATGIADFPKTRDKPHFLLQARNDTIVGSSQGVLGIGLGHGPTNPLHDPGVVRLETGYLDVDDPSKGTIESLGGAASHSSPFVPTSTAIQQIVDVVVGEPVSRYHPDEQRILRGGGRVRRNITVEVPGSGAAHPEELISPLDLSEAN